MKKMEHIKETIDLVKAIFKVVVAIAHIMFTIVGIITAAKWADEKIEERRFKKFQKELSKEEGTD